MPIPDLSIIISLAALIVSVTSWRKSREIQGLEKRSRFLAEISRARMEASQLSGACTDLRLHLRARNDSAEEEAAEWREQAKSCVKDLATVFTMVEEMPDWGAKLYEQHWPTINALRSSIIALSADVEAATKRLLAEERVDLNNGE